MDGRDSKGGCASLIIVVAMDTPWKIDETMTKGRKGEWEMSRNKIPVRTAEVTDLSHQLRRMLRKLLSSLLLLVLVLIELP